MGGGGGKEGVCGCGEMVGGKQEDCVGCEVHWRKINVLA